jgi:hypothetical protein
MPNINGKSKVRDISLPDGRPITATSRDVDVGLSTTVWTLAGAYTVAHSPTWNLDVLAGFLGPDGQADGRPLGMALDAQGARPVADDVGNVIWRVSRQP